MVTNNVCRGYALRIAVGITLIVLLLTEGASATTLTVNVSGGADYTKIQDAINNASSGDTIEVMSGTYFENVNVNKQLILKGVDTGGKPIINAKKSGRAITLSAGNSTLEGFRAVNSSGMWPRAGIYVDSNNNLLKGNIVSNNDYGIFLYYSSNNTLSNNNASKSDYGIFLDNSNNNTLSNNAILKNFVGIDISLGSKFNTLSGNNASNNNYGIILTESIYNTLSHKIILNNNYAISLNDLATNNTLSHNIILNNNYIFILDGSYPNKIYNNIFNNTNSFIIFSSITTTKQNNQLNTTKTTGINIVGGPYLGGNFWANSSGTGFSQTCTDADRDGICDLPYVIDANNTDYLPLSMNFKVRYIYGSILPPINADGTSIFKLGKTIPVKFQLQDGSGNFITNAVAKIYVAKISDGIIGTEMEANSTSNATTGNLFRYDSTSNQYIFNLGTKTLSTGAWQIRIELDDGTSKYVTISLR